MSKARTRVAAVALQDRGKKEIVGPTSRYPVTCEMRAGEICARSRVCPHVHIPVSEPTPALVPKIRHEIDRGTLTLNFETPTIQRRARTHDGTDEHRAELHTHAFVPKRRRYVACIFLPPLLHLRTHPPTQSHSPLHKNISRHRIRCQRAYAPTRVLGAIGSCMYTLHRHQR